MRLWHKDILPYISNQRLLGQHRECCALRGCGWGKKHSIVDYIFAHPYEMLYNYHSKVIAEMKLRLYHVDRLWEKSSYRGRLLGHSSTNVHICTVDYPEHTDQLLLHDVSDLLQREDYKYPHYSLCHDERKSLLLEVYHGFMVQNMSEKSNRTA
jgi:uncharacterized protein (TIGR02328 family)